MTVTDTSPIHAIGYRWAACSAAEFGHVGAQRHLVRPGSHTTACGCSASHPNIWRGNTTKPKCASCVSRGEHNAVRATTSAGKWHLATGDESTACGVVLLEFDLDRQPFMEVPLGDRCVFCIRREVP